ncbi:MAG: hypothetical protein WC151_08660, partial [Bacteroidales bacterium]
MIIRLTFLVCVIIKNLRQWVPVGFCVTKVAGTPGHTMDCTTAVQEGMVVTAFDPELERNCKHRLDYLLAEHREEKENLKWDELHALSVRYGLDDPKVRSYPSVRGKANFHVD